MQKRLNEAAVRVVPANAHPLTAPRPPQAAPRAKSPSISVVGLGYVGAVSMACLASLGHRMIGVDLSLEKVRAIKDGASPIVEDRLGDLLCQGVDNGLIDATQNLVAAVLETDVTLLSVGTPTAPDGGCDLTYVRQASCAIGQALAMKSGFHVVVLRCSVPPGTTLGVVAREIEAASGKVVGRDFGVCFNPEFLREGVAVADFFAPPKTVIGASDAKSHAIVKSIYAPLDGKMIVTSIAAAEMVKYVDNVWHANKVTFGNEVGRICKAIGIDSHEVMDIFVQDTKLNLSPYYLKPGFAFGGSCLPKEVRAVAHLGDTLGIDLPLVRSLAQSNRRQIEDVARQLEAFAGMRIGILGITFKPNTDDIRESPALALLALLEARGDDVKVFDPNLQFNGHLRAQLNYMQHAAPELLVIAQKLEELSAPSLAALMADREVLVVTHATDAFRAAIAKRKPGVHVLDLARLYAKLPDDPTYHGIAW